MIIDCNKAQKNGNLCLGYSGDTDEPCERCKNCIKCECGYYQLGETNKDKQLEQSKEIIKKFIQWNYGCCDIPDYKEIVKQAEQFLKEIEK